MYNTHHGSLTAADGSNRADPAETYQFESRELAFRKLPVRYAQTPFLWVAPTQFPAGNRHLTSLIQQFMDDTRVCDSCPLSGLFDQSATVKKIVLSTALSPAPAVIHELRAGSVQNSRGDERKQGNKV